MAAEIAIASAVELLGNLLVQKVKFLQGVEGKVELLKHELSRMRAFLKDANKKQAENERVRNWILEIKALAEDTEDTIEMFVVNIENVRGRSLVKRCSSSPKCVCHLNTIGESIQSIQERLDDIEKSRIRYGIKDIGDVAAADGSHVESQRRLAYWKPDEQVVGMEDKTRRLLKESILDDEKKGVSVAVVEGMGGIGKSTLARAVYNHPDVVARFDCLAWVVVSSGFKPQETMAQLILQLPISEKVKQELFELELIGKKKLHHQEMLQKMLHEQLKGKSYFIVLDDVWEKEHWEYLWDAFPEDEEDETSSRVLVTTRNKVIAKYGECTFEMKVLDPENSLELLLKKASVGRKDLESIGRKMLEKCDGLPLAINTVGGLLLGKKSASEWGEVLNQINSHLGRPENNVTSILELSYLNLSPQLKACFLCLAFFKEDTCIPTKRLTNIWVGQGLIQQEGGGRTVDEIARGYLDELINRNLVQVTDLTFHDRVKNCRLHDLIREVCLKRAEKEIGFEFLKGGERTNPSDQHQYKPRHRVVHGRTVRALAMDGNKHLRSLFLLGNSFRKSESHYWKSFQLLKILDLECYTLRRLPSSFRGLIGLKYMRLGNEFHDLLELPSWLDHLKKLEVLDIGYHIVRFPDNALEMDRLVCFRAYTVYGLPVRIEWRNIETLKYIRQVDFVQCFSDGWLPCSQIGHTFGSTKACRRVEWGDCVVRKYGESCPAAPKMEWYP